MKIVVNNEDHKYELHSIEWVKNKEVINKDIIKRIDSQYILIY